MSQNLRPDVLVVGLGPAGASAARRAADSGLKVLGVDRKRTAGIPIQCAEFVPTMLSPSIDAVSSAQCQRITEMHTIVENCGADKKKNFPGVMVDRATFDQRLVDRARAAGADCRFGTSVTEISANGDVALSNGESVTASVIVGADGPYSRIGRALGSINRELVTTHQITVPLLNRHEATDIFLSSTYVGGYAWLFPTEDNANLGLGLDPRYSNQLKPLLRRLHLNLCESGRVGPAILKKTGGTIPVGGMLDVAGFIGNRLVLLCGDAAGLTNPVTGAGISAAVMSGSLVGESAAAWSNGEKDAIVEYREELDDLFGTALSRALIRRRELLNKYAASAGPSRQDLRDAWIAYPQYWAA